MTRLMILFLILVSFKAGAQEHFSKTIAVLTGNKFFCYGKNSVENLSPGCKEFCRRVLAAEKLSLDTPKPTEADELSCLRVILENLHREWAAVNVCVAGQDVSNVDIDNGILPERLLNGPQGNAGSRAGLDETNPAVVKDLGTGLTWEKIPSDLAFNWEQAEEHCALLTKDCKFDWRVPTFDELKSLYFGGTRNSIVLRNYEATYWSSSRDPDQAGHARAISFERNSSPERIKKTEQQYGALCVR